MRLRGRVSDGWEGIAKSDEQKHGQVRTARVAATLALAAVIGTTIVAHAAGSATGATTTAGHPVLGHVVRTRTRLISPAPWPAAVADAGMPRAAASAPSRASAASRSRTESRMRAASTATTSLVRRTRPASAPPSPTPSASAATTLQLSCRRCSPPTLKRGSSRTLSVKSCCVVDIVGRG